jgi:hypothetical protein
MTRIRMEMLRDGPVNVCNPGLQGFGTLDKAESGISSDLVLI